jgi:hypothetical protein
MKLSVSSDIVLGARDDRRFVTWFDVVAHHGPIRSGEARFALLHVGEVAGGHGDLWRALRAGGLEHLHDAYFHQGWYREEFAEGAGIDLLFVERVAVETDPKRNLELAIVRRLSETIGSGCQLVVMPYASPLEAAHWGQLGFEISTPGRARGLLHMKMGQSHPELVDVKGDGAFEVVGTCTTGPLAATSLRSGFHS